MVVYEIRYTFILNICIQFVSVCHDYLGMENGDIPNQGIQASDAIKCCPAIKARLNGKGKWSVSGSTSVQPWVQADIQYQTIVSGVLTQGDGEKNPRHDWVTSFKVSTFLVDTNSTQTFVQDKNGNPLVSCGDQLLNIS